MKKRLRILIFSTLTIQPFMPVLGTPVIKYTIDKFIEEDFDIYLIYSYKPEYTEKKYLCKINTIYFNLRIAKKINNIPILRFFFRPVFWLFIQINFIIKGQKLLKNKKFDLIYVCDTMSALAGFILSKYYKCPLIFRFLGSFISDRYLSILSRIRFWDEILAYKLNPDLTIMTDDGTFGDKAIQYCNKSNKNIKFWRNGVTNYQINKSKEECKNLLKLDKKFILLTVSRLDKWKRVDRSIILLSKLVKEIPNCILIIVGDGNQREYLTKLTKKLKLERNVQFIGQINGSDLALYYNACDIFLSLYDISNVCNPLFEAMMLGCTIVTIKNGETDKYIINNINGIIIEEAEVLYLHNIILKLYKNDKLRNRLGKEAMYFARSNFFSWEKRLNLEIEEIYKLCE